LEVLTGKFYQLVVVQKTRETFPSEEYCAFKYATVKQTSFRDIDQDLADNEKTV
jgi:hypothetical protein